MKALAIMTVRSEAVHLLEMFRHHTAQGVVGFIVTLHRPTEEVLSLVRGDGRVLSILEQPQFQDNEKKSMELMLQETQRFSADWLVHLDPGEYLYHLDW